MTKTIFKTVLLAIAFFMVGCSSQQKNASQSEVGNQPVARRLAWLEGDLQTDYEPNRKVAEAKVQELEGKSDPEDQLNYLAALDASGKTAEAEAKIKAFMVANPAEKRAAFLLAVHYMRRGKRELATYFFRQLEKDPGFKWKAPVLNNLGMLALREKDRLGAMDYFEKAVKAQPPVAAPYVNLGALYLQSRSFSDALPLFQKAYNLDPDFEDAALGYGVALEGTGKFDEAQGVYAKFGQDHPDSLSIVYNNAIVLGNRLKKKEEAAQLMLRYIQRGGKETAKAQEIVQSWR